MIVLILYLSLGASWEDQALSVAGQIAMSEFNASFSAQISDIFSSMNANRNLAHVFAIQLSGRMIICARNRTEFDSYSIFCRSRGLGFSVTFA
jgi:hypothetical protein